MDGNIEYHSRFKSMKSFLIYCSRPCVLGNCSMRCSTSCILAVVDPGNPCRDDELRKAYADMIKWTL
jgi:hypothetical protein